MSAGPVVVVGAGLAGLAAAVRLAEAGRRVTLLAVGVGGLHLSPGVVDVAGYAPERVDDPFAGALRLAADETHPYAVIGVARVRRAVDWLRELIPLAGGGGRNLTLPTAVGALRPTAFAPASMVAGDPGAGGPYLIAGFGAFKDLHPGLVAETLAAASGIPARGVVLDASPRPGYAEVSATVLARALDTPAFRAQVAAELAPQVRPGERIGVPAVLGLERHDAAWADLQDRLGAPVFEIPTVPPCIAGIRMYEHLAARLRRAAVRTVMGVRVCGVEVAGDRIAAVRVTAASGVRAVPAADVVFAPGGVESGAIAVDSHGRVSEAVLDLPLAGVPAAGAPLFDSDYWADHPMARVGVAVDATMRPVGADGRPVFANLRAAGGILAGAVPWREKSGEGIALGSAIAAAEAILEEPA